MSQHSMQLSDRRAHSFSEQNSSAQQERFGQYMTPRWIAEAIIERYFAELPHRARMLEPSCGTGRFLDAARAIRPDLELLGVEIDAANAEIARNRGHAVICADFLLEPIAEWRLFSAIVGNPPFVAKSIDAFLLRSHELLIEGGIAGFILPTYYFQSATRTSSLNERWSMRAEQIPRSIFPGLSEPLCFALLTKDQQRSMIGFAFYGSAAGIQKWQKRFREIAEQGSASSSQSVWLSVVDRALRDLGGEADLPTLYAAIQGKRPTPNPHWRAKIRQIVQLHCERIDRGRYALKAAA